MTAWLLAWLVLSALMFVSKSFVCSGELPGNDGNLIDFIQDIISFSSCDGIAPEFGFLLTLLMWFPGLLLIGQFVIPVVQALASHPAGLLLLVAFSLTAFVGLFFAVV